MTRLYRETEGSIGSMGTYGSGSVEREYNGVSVPLGKINVDYRKSRGGSHDRAQSKSSVIKIKGTINEDDGPKTDDR